MKERSCEEIIFNITKLLWKKYNIITKINEELPNLIYGSYITIELESRKKMSYINIDLKKIRLNCCDLEMSEMFLYTLLHETGHFLLEKSKYIQKESYANYAACFLMQALLGKPFFLKILKKLKNHFMLHEVLVLSKESKSELNEICSLFLYIYKKEIDYKFNIDPPNL